jgi:uncharacterized protein DUF3891
MLHRQDNQELIVISQPAHAWVSGQLARAWGNKIFGDFAPREATCLAAELHDIGFLDWEEAPTLNSKTGRPHSFLELPTRLHLDIWSTGIKQMMQYDRYAALLVSMHFAGLTQRHPVIHPPEEAQLARDFLAEQDMLQQKLLTFLRRDAYYGVYSGEDIIARNRHLVSLWDWISLLLCMGGCQRQILAGVPGSDANIDLILTPLDTSESNRVKVSPWPFQKKSLKLVCEGRRLLETFIEEKAMRDALRTASPVTVQMDLVPG